MTPNAPDAALLTQIHRSPGGPNGEIKTPEQARKAAEEYESFFLGLMVQTMFKGVETPEAFGGGPGEKTWQGLLHEEYGKILAKSGGIGIADRLQAELLQYQSAED